MRYCEHQDGAAGGLSKDLVPVDQQAAAAALAAAGAASLERVAQGGLRVRVDAGAASSRRRASLEQHPAEAGESLPQTKQRAKDDPGGGKRRAQAARQRVAREREARVQAALEQLPQVQAAKRRNGEKAEDARISTTDADARVMKMGDGGFPAHEQIDAVHEHTAGRTELVAPVPEPRRKDGGGAPPPDRHQRKDGDFEPVAQWRERMAEEDGKAVYKQRAATAECVNALARNRGLQRMPVRGLGKARAVAFLYALANNLTSMVKIAPQWGGLDAGASAMVLMAAQGVLEVRNRPDSTCGKPKTGRRWDTLGATAPLRHRAADAATHGAGACGDRFALGRREPGSLSPMPALHPKTPRLVVAIPRHSPSHGCGLRLDAGRLGAPVGHGGRTLGL